MRKTPGHTRAGFTLLELLVAAGLSIGLTLITAQFWGYFSDQLGDLSARARAAQELRLAVDSIAQDMGAAVGATGVAVGRLVLCKDGGDVPNGSADWGEPDTLVMYSLVDGQLVREDRSTGVAVVVADSISAFLAEDLTESVVQMTIAVTRGDVTRQASLLWSRP